MRTGSQTTGLFTLSRNQGNWHNYMQGARLGCGKRQRECKVRGDWKIENRRLEKWEPSRGRWEVRATLRCPKSTANSQHLSTEHTHPSTQQTLTECPSTQRPQQARVPTHTELSLPGETGKRELSDTDMCCEEKVGRVPGAAGWVLWRAVGAGHRRAGRWAMAGSVLKGVSSVPNPNKHFFLFTPG